MGTKTEVNIIEAAAKIKILGKLAEGGMGAIYLAEQHGAAGFKKTVAVKTIRPELLERPDAAEMFVGEAKLSSDLIHENILQIYALNQTRGGFVMVMEYVVGKNIEKLIRDLKTLNKPIDPDLGAFIVSRVCRGLHYAHKIGR